LDVDPEEVNVVSQPTDRGYLVGIAADIVGATFRLLSRQEEYVVTDRDEYGRFLWAHSASKVSAEPLVNRYAKIVLEGLQTACTHAGLATARKEYWPFGKPMAGCLSHDVDVVRRGKLPRGVAVRDVVGTLSNLGRGRLGRACRQMATIARIAIGKQDPYWTFERISAMEDSHGYRSTYFFMSERLHPEDAVYDLRSPKMAQLIGGLTARGCEIALHGSCATHTDSAMLLRQKKLLEGILGKTVTGHRNHYLKFQVSQSWKAQEAAGFSYDSTLGFADHEGFRGGCAFPFFPYDLVDDRRLNILEIPLSIMDVSISKYQRLRGEASEQALRSCLEKTLDVNGLATLLWHNDTFFEPERPGFAQLYETALAWLSEKDTFVATCAEIDRWWKARAAVRLYPLGEGRKGWRLESPIEIDGLVLRVSIPDPRSLLRLRGQVSLSIKRDGVDHLMEFGRLPAGSSVDVEYS